jgi:hypothetical protein
MPGDMSSRELLEMLVLSPDERAAMTVAATHTADFVICRNLIRIRANTRLPIDGFLLLYRQLLAGSDTSQPADLTLCCYYENAGPDKSATFLIGDQAYRIRDADLMARPLVTMTYILFPNIRSHYLVHGGCVSRNGQGIIISGASGMGKTTLTTYLASRSMRLLSDEFSPIHRTEATVDPFPLSLGIRPGPARELTRDLPGVDYAFGTDLKKLVDAGTIGAGPASEPVPLHAVVFLSQRPGHEVATAAKFDGTAQVSFMNATPEFREDLLAEAHATLTKEESLGYGVVTWHLVVKEPGQFLQTLYAVAGRHGVPIAGLEYEDLDDSDYSKSPEMVEIPKSAGVIELIKKVLPYQKRALLDSEFRGSMPGMIGELGRLVQHAAFYKMRPGRLNEMIALVENLP